MLISCVAYQEGHKLADIPVEETASTLRRPGTFVWAALRDAAAVELAHRQRESGLHEPAVQDALKGHHRPKLEEFDPTLFAVMQLIEAEPAGWQAGGWPCSGR